jgi:hypothetical protein
MAWQRGTVRIKYPADPGRGQMEDSYEEHPGYVNTDHDLTVRKNWGGWQIDTIHGSRVRGFIRTMADAKRVADAIAPLAPYGWTNDGARRAAAEDPQWGAKVKAAADEAAGCQLT